ncbi:S-layer homology domain-containing protein [Niallia oryzisoli]|uniref:S-layer homology domain-containing protein n=1 Tax=Niallia oryzisoli TaxID=1737571 RepID=A0ABZ2CB10_9BACI
MKNRFIIFLIGLFLFCLPLQTAAAEGSIPSFPALAYGDVTINQQPAAAGIEVTAKVDGKVVGNILISEPGKYGGAGTKSKLLITGDGFSGKNVEFYLTGKQGSIALNQVKAKEELYWGAGEVKKIDFNVTVEEPVQNPPTTGGTGGGAVQPAPGNNQDTIVDGIAEDLVSVDNQNGKANVSFLESKDLGLEKEQVLTVKMTEDVEELNTQLSLGMLNSMKANDNTLQIETNRATYSLPVSKLDIDNILDQFGAGTDPNKIQMNVKITEPSESDIQVLEQVATEHEVTLLVKPISFTIQAKVNNQSFEVKDFNGYVERMIKLSKDVDASKVTTAVVISPDGTMSHVPTKIIEKNGEYFVVINSRTNSFYTVIHNEIGFQDVENHWSKDYINSMASKLIINGVDENHFEPNRSITRAEFAAIINRALGLKYEETDQSFTDVPETKWYYEPVLTSYKYGLIKGYQEGTFRPNDSITREQAMAIIAQAMKLTELKVTMDEKTAANVVGKFTDYQSIGDWATQSVAITVKNGVVDGFADNSLKPKNQITRAEAAKMIHNTLVSTDLITK